MTFEVSIPNESLCEFMQVNAPYMIGGIQKADHWNIVLSVPSGFSALVSRAKDDEVFRDLMTRFQLAEFDAFELMCKAFVLVSNPVVSFSRN